MLSLTFYLLVYLVGNKVFIKWFEKGQLLGRQIIIQSAPSCFL